MFLPNDPCVLDDLTDFEARLLSKRIPFMKITALPRGKQQGIVGSVINVPSDVDQTCENLPRTPSSAGIIPVKLKRKQEYKSHVFYEHVRPQKVIEGFEWLKNNNPHYHHVIDSSAQWEQTSTAEDKELWDHLTLPMSLDNTNEEDLHQGSIDPQQQGADAPQQGSSAPQQQGSSTPHQGSIAPQQQGSNAPQQGSSAPQQQNSDAPHQGSNAPQQQGSSTPKQPGFSTPHQGSITPQQQGASTPKQQDSIAPNQGSSVPQE